MKILLVFDTWGWCHENKCQGIQKYSKYSCDLKCHPMDKSDLSIYDIIYLSSPELWEYPSFKSKRKAKIIVGIGSIKQGKAATRHADAFICHSKELTNGLRKRFPKIPATFIPNGIDSEIFRPLGVSKQSFNVGWIGNLERPEKRTYLLKQLDFPVQIKSDLIYHKNLSREPIVQFYNNMDVIVLVSSSEGCSNVVLEAGACKTAVICTKTGCQTDIVPDHWLVPCYPENETIRLLNERLHELANDPVILSNYKEELHKTILEKYTWKKVVKNYETVFEGVYVS